ncbi:hypothetical protein [Cupriavidus sp. IK-TO18]|uniref:hypothetical protein n=1 Tax=Cupriavidus sp. IK-TO18 TaxID=2782182 RepID=UPI00189B862E|nr:hypothetical protein [Cupriavidus sp. IK-TO18]MBF6987279.1 hypothetical protein [Cupriavidus sp. IK-TO18]
MVEIKAKTAVRSVGGIAAMSERRIAARTAAPSVAKTEAVAAAATALMTVEEIAGATAVEVEAEIVATIDRPGAHRRSRMWKQIAPIARQRNAR